MKIQHLLNTFKAKYAHGRVVDEPIDLTECFLSTDKNRYIAPRSYGDLTENKVFAYVIFGIPLYMK